MLYDRDYRLLTTEEQSKWEIAEYNLDKKKQRIYSPKALKRYHEELPKAALHYMHLFPNNYLHPNDFKNEKSLNLLKEYILLLDSRPTERDILNFIRENQGYFIIASILKYYRFGHHEAYAFKEFELPPNYIVDYLLIGKNSEGYHFVFVELESSHGSITNSGGEYGSVIRKGIDQVRDWDNWLEKNYSHLKLMYEKYIGKMEPLPNEFFELDKSRIHYVVVAGRRVDYTEKTYSLKRKQHRSESVLLVHYDNLIDTTLHLLKDNNF